MPPSSWCNWWKCAENQVLVAARVSAFVSVILTLQYWVSSVCSYITLPSLWPCSRPHWVVSCERWAAVWSSSCVHYKFFYAFTCIPLSLYVCVLSRIKKKTGCLLAVFHTDGKKCSGFTALHADCLTSRTKTAPAFFLLSLCQREGCYGCSAARNLFMLSEISWKSD